MASDYVPDAPIDDTDLAEETKRNKERLQNLAMKSKMLQHQVYQEMMRGKLPRAIREGERQLIQQGVSSDAIDKFKNAFAEGYSMRMFREGFEGKPEQQPPAQAAPQEESKFVSEWMSWARSDPEGAKEFINGLSKEQLDKIAYLNFSKEGGGMALWAAMRDASSGKKSGTSEAIEIINAVRPPTINELLDAQMKLRDQVAPKEESEVVKLLREEVSEIKKTNEELREALHQEQISQRDNEIRGLSSQIKDLESKIPTAESMWEAYEEREKRIEGWAKVRGFTKESGGRSKEDKDWDRIQDVTDTALTHFGPLIGAYAKRVAKDVGEGSKTKRFTCDCGEDIDVPWPPKKSIFCPACGQKWDLKEKPTSTTEPEG